MAPQVVACSSGQWAVGSGLWGVCVCMCREGRERGGGGFECSHLLTRLCPYNCPFSLPQAQTLTMLKCELHPAATLPAKVRDLLRLGRHRCRPALRLRWGGGRRASCSCCYCCCRAAARLVHGRQRAVGLQAAKAPARSCALQGHTRANGRWRRGHLEEGFAGPARKCRLDIGTQARPLHLGEAAGSEEDSSPGHYWQHRGCQLIRRSPLDECPPRCPVK